MKCPVQIAGRVLWVGASLMVTFPVAACTSGAAGAVHDAGPRDAFKDTAGPMEGTDYPPETDGGGGPDCNAPVLVDGGHFTVAGELLVARDTPGVAPLPGGKILVTGGVSASGVALTTAEIFDPSTGTSTPTGGMASMHLWGGWGAPLPTLPDGRILVAGGVDQTGTIQAGAELYDPDAGTFSPTGAMAQAVVSMFPVVLTDGTVLEVGGSDVSIESTPSSCPNVFECWSGAGISQVQRYSPNMGSFAETGALSETRPWGCTVLLQDGKVLAIGVPANVQASDHDIEQYDPMAGTWQTVGTAPTAYCEQAFALPNGKVLMVGTGATPDGQLLDPATLSATATLGDVTGWSYSIAQIANGDVLLIGTRSVCAERVSVRQTPPCQGVCESGIVRSRWVADQRVRLRQNGVDVSRRGTPAA